MGRKTLTIFLLAALLAVPVASHGEDGGDAFVIMSRAYRKAAEAIAPSVVHIDVVRERDIGQPAPRAGSGNRRTPRRRGVGLPPRILDKYQENRRYFSRPEGGTSGVIVSSDGHILTSWYNMAGVLKSVTVTLADGRSFPARLLGKDEDKDVCIIKVDAAGLPAADLSPAALVKPGQFCVAVGRGKNPAAYTMTTGIVSARKRNRGQAFQISARVNYANAGGAVVDLRGRLLGVVSRVAHLAQLNRSGLNTGVGLATPVPKVLEVFDRLKAGETIPRFRGPFLGIRFDMTHKGKGVKIEYVYKDLPSAKAGLRNGDVIIMFNNIQIESRFDLIFAIQQCDPNQKVGFTVIRKVEGEEHSVDLWAVLTLRPPQDELTKMTAEYEAWKKKQAK